MSNNPQLYKAKEIANFYIQLANDLPNNYIDNLKLNKILYYAQGWSLAKRGVPLFSDDIQAWDYGPVVPNIYHTYKICGNKPIEEPENFFDEAELQTDVLELLIDVYQNYGKFTGWALKEMTHSFGSPWQQFYQVNENKIIPHNVMKEYFENETLETFDVKNLNIPISSSVPIEWDSEEDRIYD